MSELGKLYQQAILEHHRAPRHAGRLDQPTHAAGGHNPLCGDRVDVTLSVAGERLLDARCEVKGCAICRASGSMMTEAIIGREVSEVRALIERFLAAVARDPGPSDSAAAVGPAASSAPADEAEAREWGPLAALLEARRFPNRRRCAGLSWETLARALSL